MANAAKHAHASLVDIDLRLEDGVVCVEVADDGSGGAVIRRGRGPWGPARPRAVRRQRDDHRQRSWARHPAAGLDPVRVILIDAALVRQGLARLLTDDGIEVAAQLDDAVEVAAAIGASRRAPSSSTSSCRPTPPRTRRRARAARPLPRARRPPAPNTSSPVTPSSCSRSIGLLKERIADPAEFAAAVRRVAAGGTMIDPEVVRLVLRRSRPADPLAELTAREREILQLIAEGWSNPAIAKRLWLTIKTVESRAQHLPQTRPPPELDHDRRVRCVLVHLRTAKASRRDVHDPPLEPRHSPLT